MDLLLGLSLFGVAFIVALIVPILGWVRAAHAMNEVRQLAHTHRGNRTRAEESHPKHESFLAPMRRPPSPRSPSW